MQKCKKYKIMKNLFKYTMGALVAGTMMTACSPDSFDGADETQTPSVNGINISVDVDQATNTLVATAPDAAMGTYHVWNLPPTANSWSDTDKADIWSTLKSAMVLVRA